VGSAALLYDCRAIVFSPLTTNNFDTPRLAVLRRRPKSDAQSQDKVVMGADPGVEDRIAGGRIDGPEILELSHQGLSVLKVSRDPKLPVVQVSLKGADEFQLRN